jgi:CBS domain-containing protein
MTVEPVSIEPHATLLEATKLIHQHSLGALLVTEGDRLLGLLSVSDILRLVIEQHKSDHKTESVKREAEDGKRKA